MIFRNSQGVDGNDNLEAIVVGASDEDHEKYSLSTFIITLSGVSGKYRNKQNGDKWL